MTLKQYKVEIVEKLKKLEAEEHGDDYEEHLIELNSLSQTIHNALKDHGDDSSLNHLNKHVMLAIMLMELAIDCDLITLKTS